MQQDTLRLVTQQMPEFRTAVDGQKESEHPLLVMDAIASFGWDESHLLWAALDYAREQGVSVLCLGANRTLAHYGIEVGEVYLDVKP